MPERAFAALTSCLRILPAIRPLAPVRSPASFTVAITASRRTPAPAFLRPLTVFPLIRSLLLMRSLLCVAQDTHSVQQAQCRDGAARRADPPTPDSALAAPRPPPRSGGGAWVLQRGGNSW